MPLFRVESPHFCSTQISLGSFRLVLRIWALDLYCSFSLSCLEETLECHFNRLEQLTTNPMSEWNHHVRSKATKRQQYVVDMYFVTYLLLLFLKFFSFYNSSGTWFTSDSKADRDWVWVDYRKFWRFTDSQRSTVREIFKIERNHRFNPGLPFIVGRTKIALCRIDEIMSHWKISWNNNGCIRYSVPNQSVDERCGPSGRCSQCRIHVSVERMHS